MQMTLARRKPLVVALALAAAVLATAFAVRALGGDDGPARTVPIASSYVFDVGDKRLVAGYARHVFVGRVSEVVGVNEDASSTQYSVEVLETLKGRPQSRAIVSQLGYVSGNERHETHDQPLLEVGATYVLATTGPSDGVQTVIGGPVASARITSADARRSTVDDYRRAVREQRYPEGVPPPANSG